MVNSLLGRFLKFIVVLLIIIIILSLSYDKIYRGIVLLPFSYLLINLIYDYGIKRGRVNKYTGGFVYKAALIVIFVRYVLTPLSIALTEEYYFRNIFTSEESTNIAILLMIFELICAYTTLLVARIYYSKRYNEDLPSQITGLNNKFVLGIVVIVGIPVLLLVEPNLIIPSEFLVLNENFSKLNLEIAYDGVFTSLAVVVKPIIFLLLFSKIKAKYDLKKRNIYIWLVFLLIVIFMAMYTGTQRWEFVFAGIIGLYLAKKTFIEIPKSMIIGIVVIMTISFLSASLYKFSWAVQTSLNPIKDVLFEMFKMLQDYFSGPRGVANSIEMTKVYGGEITLNTFINDFIGTMPVISNFVDQSNRINVYFNLYHNITNTALIIPMIGIGYAYFPIFAPIFTVISQWYIIKIDYKFETSKSIEFRYLYLYLGLYLSMSMGFNTQIIFGKFLIPFLPLLFLFNINKIICLKKKSGFYKVQDSKYSIFIEKL
jgi:hypothetical protein